MELELNERVFATLPETAEKYVAERGYAPHHRPRLNAFARFLEAPLFAEN